MEWEKKTQKIGERNELADRTHMTDLLLLHICDVIKQNESEVENMILCFVGILLLGYCLGLNLMKTSQRLGNWLWKYKQLKDWTNNNKQKKLSALFDCILKTVSASSDSFCLIKSHMWWNLHVKTCHMVKIWYFKLWVSLKKMLGYSFQNCLNCFSIIPTL